jgi:hypothetical protein
MARDEMMSYEEAFGSAVASRKARKKKPAKKAASKKSTLKPGGSSTSGRAIPTSGRAVPIGIPGPKKKKAMTGSKEKRVAGPSVGRSQRRNQGPQIRTRSKY